MSNITADIRAERLAADFLRSAGVKTYADQRRTHLIHVGVWSVLAALSLLALCTYAGPPLLAWFHQSLVSVHQSVQLLHWTPQS